MRKHRALRGHRAWRNQWIAERRYLEIQTQLWSTNPYFGKHKKTRVPQQRRGRKRNEGEGSRNSEVGEWWRIVLNQSRR